MINLREIAARAGYLHGGTPCPHLGPQKQRKGTGLSVRCGCSGKERELVLPVHNCDQFTRCLPSFRPTNQQREELEKIGSDTLLYKWCCDCPLNPMNQP